MIYKKNLTTFSIHKPWICKLCSPWVISIEDALSTGLWLSSKDTILSCLIVLVFIPSMIPLRSSAWRFFLCLRFISPLQVLDIKTKLNSYFLSLFDESKRFIQMLWYVMLHLSTICFVFPSFDSPNNTSSMVGIFDRFELFRCGNLWDWLLACTGGYGMMVSLFATKTHFVQFSRLDKSKSSITILQSCIG